MTVGIARMVEPFTFGADALEPFTDDALSAVTELGCTWVGQYLENLTPKTRDRIFSRNMGIKLITEARVSALSADVGRLSADLEVRRLRILECPTRLHVTIDLESAHGRPLEVEEYVDTFARGFSDAAFDAELYVGPGQPLDARELWALLPDRYWRSSSLVPEPSCGYSTLQLWPNNWELSKAGGFKVDMNVTQADRLGRLPTLWWPT